ncbi:MAG: hypothetical protein WCE20_01455 [Rhizomicrobium sp.]
MHPSVIFEKTPDKPAINMAASGETLTSRQLEERSNQGAQLFRKPRHRQTLQAADSRPLLGKARIAHRLNGNIAARRDRSGRDAFVEKGERFASPGRMSWCRGVLISSLDTEINRRAVMRDGRGRFVEMVKQRAPTLIAFRLAKSDRVIFERPPRHQQQIAIGGLETAAQLHTHESGRCGNQRPRLFHGDLESSFFAGTHVEDCRFKDHLADIPRSLHFIASDNAADSS